jgi:hypothetical protein
MILGHTDSLNNTLNLRLRVKGEKVDPCYIRSRYWLNALGHFSITTSALPNILPDQIISFFATFLQSPPCPSHHLRVHVDELNLTMQENEHTINIRQTRTIPSSFPIHLFTRPSSSDIPISTFSIICRISLK